MNSVNKFIKPLHINDCKSSLCACGFNFQNKVQFSFLFTFIISYRVFQ
jgi:outer membrane lipopolysaccharide assembly protein LptE/RlpB